MLRATWLPFGSVLILLALTHTVAQAAEAKPDFNRDVRPILSNHCVKCHGPATQKAGVRLDSLVLAKKKDAIVPGKPDESGVITRITSEDAEDRMPPAESGPALTPAQVKILKDWIASGAEFAPHWSFVPPKQQRLPNITPAQAIDTFIHAELAKQGLKPSPEASKSTLIRRVSLDLIGLLPTPTEVEAFEKDASPDAYGKLVDRLLASPHYGERQARHWLDLARYADSNGYTVDGARSIWPYRDWVIKALNDDLPFDQFTIQQLAGDLLPNATKDQQIATGFHRNTSFNEEGGTDPEQFRVERTIDRTNTTSAVWLGLTMGCAQCHDHKYDPISQKDYYKLYAFFNSAEEPSITVGGTPELEKKINEMMTKANEWKTKGDQDEAKKVEAEIRKIQGKIPTTLVMRERGTARVTHLQIRGDFLRKGEVVQPSFPSAISTNITPAKLTRLDLAKWLVSPENPLTARVVVNRAWQEFFGRGIVDTENDFGMQGSLPTHPELLDWLAVDFASNWSMKKLHKRIVTSATYRQASLARADTTAKDPQNKFLARQSRLRMDAEIIRDVALSASGLLSHKVGGPSVYPPLPAEVFALTQSKKAWPESQGEDRFRRGMYTYIWRQSQHHLLTTFDAADAQTSCTRRNRSNTPLQALHLANDPAFQEFAAALGKRIEDEDLETDAERIDLAFQLCFARNPTKSEKERVLTYLDAQTKAAPKTAWTHTARVLMNLDEFITRE